MKNNPIEGLGAGVVAYVIDLTERHGCDVPSSGVPITATLIRPPIGSPRPSTNYTRTALPVAQFSTTQSSADCPTAFDR